MSYSNILRVKMLIHRLYANHIKNKIRKADDKKKSQLLDRLTNFYVYNITGKYSDEFIEEQYIQLADKYIDYEEYNVPENNKVLIVMSKAYSIGGHTVIANNWIKADTKREYSIAFTDMTGGKVPGFLVDSVNGSDGKIYFVHGSNCYNKAKQLIKISKNFSKIILCTHMNDSIPILAYSNRRWKTPIYFYNHANFRFVLGISIADCFLTLCDYDAAKDKEYRGADNVVVFKMLRNIVYENDDILKLSKGETKKKLSKMYNIADDDRIILSMGDDFKYKRVRRYNFQKFLLNLSKQLPENAKYIIIGADPEKKAWKRLYYKTDGRVMAIGRKPRGEVSELMKIADIYITSFPMNSEGRYEAYLNGVESFTFAITDRCKMIDNIGYKLDSIKELKDKIIEYVNENKCIGAHSVELGYDFDSIMWSEKLEEIFSVEYEHKIHKFKSKVRVTNEEVLHYELIKYNEKSKRKVGR